MWQTKYASAVPKNLGLRLNFRPCSEGYFLSGRPQSVVATKERKTSSFVSTQNNTQVTTTDYGHPEKKQSSLHGRKFNPNPKFLGTAEAYFVCHIGPIFKIFLIFAFIGCPQSVVMRVRCESITSSKFITESKLHSTTREKSNIFRLQYSMYHVQQLLNLLTKQFSQDFGLKQIQAYFNLSIEHQWVSILGKFLFSTQSFYLSIQFCSNTMFFSCSTNLLSFYQFYLLFFRQNCTKFEWLEKLLNKFGNPSSSALLKNLSMYTQGPIFQPKLCNEYNAL